MNISCLRFALIFGLASAALSAHAIDAYSNLGAFPAVYDGTASHPIGDYSSFGGGNYVFSCQFTASSGGTLTGFMVAMNTLVIPPSPQDYSLKLYTDSGTDTLGLQLGAY